MLRRRKLLNCDKKDARLGTYEFRSGGDQTDKAELLLQLLSSLSALYSREFHHFTTAERRKNESTRDSSCRYVRLVAIVAGCVLYHADDPMVTEQNK